MRLLSTFNPLRAKALLNSRMVRLGVYVAFGLLVFCISFIWTFPYTTLESRIEIEASRVLEMPVTMEHLAYDFPLGLRFDQLRISPAGGELQQPLIFRDGRIRPRPLSLLGGALRTDWSGGCFKGQLHGLIRLSPFISPKRLSLEMDWQGIELAELPVWQALPEVADASGKLSGALALAGSADRLSFDSGSGEVRLDEVSVRIAGPGDFNRRLEDIRGKTVASLQGDVLTIESLELAAQGLDLSGSGSVRLVRPASRSLLDLRGRLRFSKAEPELYSLAKRLMPSTTPRFRVQGRLTQPRTTLNK